MVVKTSMILKNIFKKKQKPFIRFYSIENGVEILHPVYSAAKLKRSWMQCPVEHKEESQLGETRLCPGIRLLNSTGWILPAPADFKIKTNGDGTSWEWTSSTVFNNGPEPGYLSLHPPSQAVPVLDDPSKTLSSIIKVDTPWRLECSDDIMLLQLPVPYNNESRFTVQPGLIDPAYTHNLNIQMVWNILDGEEWVTSGTPLVQYIPIPRSYMNTSFFDVIVNGSDDIDQEKERAFHYVHRATAPGEKHDTLKFRLAKIKKILNKYKSIRRNK